MTSKEALKNIKEYLLEKLKEDGSELGFLIIKENVDVLEQLVERDTPIPTEDEVCKALSKRYNNAGIQYLKDKKSFVFGYLLRPICWLKEDGTIYWGTDDLTPPLTTMIGKFYESLEEETK